MKKNKKISGWIKNHPTKSMIGAMMLLIALDILVALYRYLKNDGMFTAYLLGSAIVIPFVIIKRILCKEKEATREKDFKNQLRNKDLFIAKLQQKIKNDKDSVDAGMEATRQYNDLEQQTREFIVQVQKEQEEEERRSAVFRALYAREDFPQKVFRFSRFIWNHTDALGLFDPVAYLTDRKYHAWVNGNVDDWNKIIEDYSHNFNLCLDKLKKNMEKNKPKATSGDTVPELERSTKKLSHISNDREDR